MLEKPIWAYCLSFPLLYSINNYVAFLRFAMPTRPSRPEPNSQTAAGAGTTAVPMEPGSVWEETLAGILAGAFSNPLYNANVSTGGTWSDLPKLAPGLLTSGKPIVLAFADTGENPIHVKTNIGNIADTAFLSIVIFNISIPFDLPAIIYSI